MITVILTLSILNVSVFALEDSQYFEEKAKATGITAEYLKESYKLYGKELFEVIIDEYIEKVELYGLLSDDEIPISIMSSYWEGAQWSVKTGSVFITRDNKTKGIRHGHAAIVSYQAVWFGEKIIYVTEAVGEDYEVDQYQVNAGYPFWTNRSTLKICDVRTTASEANDIQTMAKAGAKSFDYLGWKYDALGYKNSTTHVNCDSLVYKEYSEVNIELGKYFSFWVIPADLAEDRRLVVAYRYNWSGYGW